MDKIFKFLSKNSLVISIILFASLFFVFYPSKSATIDEHDYLNNAKLILTTGVKGDCKEHIPGQWPFQGYCISKYNIGTSLILIPSTFLGDQFAFITTLLIFIAAICVFYFILKEFEIDPIFVFLFAFYPPFVYFSRTILSEIYSVFFILTAFFIYLKSLKLKKESLMILSGISAGIAIFIRYTNILPIGILTLLLFFQEYKEHKKFKAVFYKALFMGIGLLPIILIIMNFNYMNYGSVFRSGYYISHEEGVFDPSQLLTIPFIYIGLFLIFYPGMFAFSFLSKIKYKVAMISTFVCMILFYSVVKNTSLNFKASDIILNMRFLIPLSPFLLILYFDFLNKFLNRKFFKTLLIIFIFAILFFSIILTILHFRYLNSLMI